MGEQFFENISWTSGQPDSTRTEIMLSRLSAFLLVISEAFSTKKDVAEKHRTPTTVQQ